MSHGTTVATNALLSEEGSFPGLGLIVTRGFKHLLEIARQSVPQGYGNSYFWVKPERIVPLHLVREVTERVDFRGQVLQPIDLDEAEAAARWFRDQGIECIGVCLLHAYACGEHEQLLRDVLLRVHPEASVSISSEVLPEYREYERAMTTLVDAFVKPRVSRYVAQIDARLREQVGTTTPFYIMKSNGGVVSAREVASQPDQHVTERSSRGRAGRRAAGECGRLCAGADAGWRWHQYRCGRGRRRRATPDHRRPRRALPGQGAHDRRGHGRRRRRLDRPPRASTADSK